MTLLPAFRDQIHHAATQPRRTPGWLPRRHRPTRRHSQQLLGSIPVALSGITTLAIAAAAVTLLGHRSTTHHPTTPASRQAQPAWLSELATRFALLRKSPSVLPPALAKQLTTFGVPIDGLRYAHKVAFPAGTIWIVPEPAELCAALVLPGSRALAGETCEGPGGLGMSAGRREHPNQPPGPRNPLWAVKAGIVDNHVIRVQFTRPDGTPATQTTKDNTFLVKTLPDVLVKRERSRK